MKNFFFKILCIHNNFSNDKRAATAIEYALIGAGIALAIVAIVFLLGDDVAGLFQNVQTEISGNL